MSKHVARGNVTSFLIHDGERCLRFERRQQNGMSDITIKKKSCRLARVSGELQYRLSAENVACLSESCVQLHCRDGIVVRGTSRPKFCMYFSCLIPATHLEQLRFLCISNTVSLHDLYELWCLSLWTEVLSPTLSLLGSNVLFSGLFCNALSLCFQLTVKEQTTEPHN
jgi:hypothetical protein